MILQEWDAKVRRWNIERKRFSQIAAALPEAIDLWVLVLQAGLDLQVAFRHFIDKGPSGPLRDEIARTVWEIQMGSSRVDALRRLAERVREPSLQETVRIMIQGIELGSSIAPMLRQQAQMLRQSRAYAAERRAAVAPLKLLFPLFVFIFPTILIVLFGPLYLTIRQGLSR